MRPTSTRAKCSNKKSCKDGCASVLSATLLLGPTLRIVIQVGSGCKISWVFLLRLINPNALSLQKSLSYARGLSEVGNALRYVTLALAILSIRSLPKDLIFAETLETLGFITAGVLTPFFIDRVHRIRALIVADLLSLGVCAVLVAGVLMHSLPLLFVASFLITSVSNFYGASLRAATADLTDNSHSGILAGLSLLQVCNISGALLGSLLAAKFLKWLPFQYLFAIDGVTFLISSFWIFLILKKIPDRNKVPSDSSTDPEALARKNGLRAYLGFRLTEWSEGFRVVLAHPTARMLVLAQGFVGMGYGVFSSLIVSHYKTNLGFKDRTVALAQANNRVWALSGAVLRLKSVKRESRKTLIRANVLMVLGYSFVGLAHGLEVLFFNGIANLAMSMSAPTNNAAVIASIEPHLRGRVEALRDLVIDMGILLGNLLALSWISQGQLRLGFPVAGVAVSLSLVMYLKISKWPSQSPQPKAV